MIMDVLEKQSTGLKKLADALPHALPHNTHFVITGVNHESGQEIIDFLKKYNFLTPRNNTAGDYKFLAIPTPKGQEFDRMRKALQEKGISPDITNSRGNGR